MATRQKLTTASCMATSTRWPLPVLWRWRSAASTPTAAWTPVPVSPIVGPGFKGGESGVPVKHMAPPVAWAIMSKLLYWLYGA